MYWLPSTNNYNEYQKLMKPFAGLPCKIKIPEVSSIVHVAKIVDISSPANSRNYCRVGDEYRASKKYRKTRYIA